MKAKEALVGIVLGAAAGFAMGILLAPEKGSRTRRRLLEKGEDSLEDFKDGVNHAIRDLKKKVDAVSLQITDKI